MPTSVAERLTVRDLVTHRSGLPRHDLVWYGSDRSREELLGGIAVALWRLAASGRAGTPLHAS